jgi:septum formation protein
MRLILASGSPRRKELLGHLGVDFDILVTDVDESLHTEESPPDYVTRLAIEKAAAAARPESIAIGADTTVAIDGQIFGKPADVEDAARMLGLLSGRTHEVFTGVGLSDGSSITVRTEVTFASLASSDIAWYIATGEPMDKAGAYGMQSIGGAFVASIVGSYSNVIGLPLVETAELLRVAGITVMEPRKV